MTRHLLTPHPACPTGPIRRITADISTDLEGGVRIEFRAAGVTGGIRIPETTPPARQDNLWRTTCFEAFFAAPDGRYLEFNFSPSTQWAAYAFGRYRERVEAAQTPTPDITRRVTARQLTLTAKLRFSEDRTFSPQEGIRLGLSAVIEDNVGGITYWALSHPSDKPDFHHPGGFMNAFGDQSR